jgi:hypothetical protein
MVNILDKFKTKYTCFCCKNEVDKKAAFSVKLDTSEGMIELKACELCAEELNDILKDFEEAFGDVKRL